MVDVIAQFQSREATYQADTCEPLKAAARRGDLELAALSKGAYPGRQIPESLLELLEDNNIPLDNTLTLSRRSVELFLKRLPETLEYPWTLQAMADECSLGRSQFADHCKQLTNMTPLEYLTHCRLETACKLLTKQPSIKIIEVSNACGFGSSQYFATVFRNKLGCTPSEYPVNQTS
jgi:transcriptional regulator GlxA family with amidase domain